ncbi:MAG: adenylate/guanylate cyclase domain-containing protein [Candidatus Omnitrophota bacterium]
MTLSRKTRQHAIGLILGIAAAFGEVNFLFDPRPNAHEPLFALDAWLYDRLLIHRTAYTPDPNKNLPEIFIVAFDEDSFSSMAMLDDPRLSQWPWSPALFAQAIDRLKQLGAAVIGIDKLFVETHLLNDPAHQDGLEKELAEASRRHGKVVLASKMETNRVEGAAVQTMKNPREVLLDAAYRGVVSLPIDPDETIRRAFTGAKHQDSFYPAFAVQIARLFLNLEENKINLKESNESTIGDLKIPLHHETFPIAYDGQRVERFPFYLFLDPFYDLLSDQFFGAQNEHSFDTDRLKNSIVLMGATTGELHDEFQSPIDSKPIPGVEVHANIVKTILSRSILRRAGDRLQIWGTFCLAAAISALCAFASIRAGILGSLAVISFWIAGGAAALLYGGLILRLITPSVCLALAAASTISYRYIFEEREKRFLKKLFSKATDAALVEQMLENPDLVKLGGDRRRITVLFSDIRSFTPLSESMDPQALIDFLNRYFTAMTEVIFRNHGMIDKFIGDAVMAIFGAPIPNEDHAYFACKAAVEMLEAQREISRAWEEQGHEPFHIGIGIHSGFAVLGNLGSEKRSDYTCIGDAVNLASRIEGINKRFQTEALISDDTYKECMNDLEVRNLGENEIRGRKGKVILHELMNVRPRGEATHSQRRSVI